MAVRVFIPGDAGTYQNYRRAVERAGGIACFGSDAAACSCLLLPGGGDLAPQRYGQPNTASQNIDLRRDALEAHLLALFAAKGKPILGICRGMQAINVFFGGDLIQEQPGHSQCGNADRFHAVYTKPSLLRGLYGARCTVNSAHHQAVGQLGQGLEALQWADDGVIEAFRHRTLPILGIQWHPERLTIPGAADGFALYRAFLAGAKL